MSASVNKDFKDRIDSVLKEMSHGSRGRSADRAGASSRRQSPYSVSRSLIRVGLFALTVVFALALPFFVLVRVATTLYLAYGWPYWIAIIPGVVLASLIIAVYARYIAAKLGVRGAVTISRTRVLGLVVFAYLAWSLMYVSASNVKTAEIRTTYRSTHPILRLAVSSLVVFDRGSVITDLERGRADYATMGLPTSETSLHYRQRDGYSHAIDLRTLGRSEFRNGVVALYFRAVGLRTIRHIGTADHLHVSLPVRN